MNSQTMFGRDEEAFAEAMGRELERLADASHLAPSEDFAERKDIETADKPREEHDRRHHEQDVESVPPA